MRFLSLAILLTVAACDGGDPVGPDTGDTDDETDTEVDDTGLSETDFVIFDTDIDTDDLLDTDTDPPTGDTGPLDTDIQSGVCPFGEIEDCTGHKCFPEYFLGDGTCDDGVTFPANFNCDFYDFDRGDCEGDTDDSDTAPPLPSGGFCDINIEVDIRNKGEEVGWRLYDPQGGTLIDVPPGTYGSYQTLYAPARLPREVLRLEMFDVGADGWGGGALIFREAFGGQELDRESIGFAVSREVTNIDLRGCDLADTAATTVDTSAPECGDVRVVLNTGDDGNKVGFRIRNEDGVVMFSTAGQFFQDWRSYTFDVLLPDDRYTFEAFSSSRSSWSGGSFTVYDRATGRLVLSGTKSGGRDIQEFDFWMDCDLTDTFRPGVDTSPPPEPDPTCEDGIFLEIKTSTSPQEYAWQVIDIASGVVVAERPFDTYFSTGFFYEDLGIGAGAWILRLIDESGNGWGPAATVRVFDGATGYDFLSESGFGGTWAQLDFPFGTQCIAGGTGAPPPPPLPTGLMCDSATTPDCQGICWPTAYIGDGFCDDGTTYAPDFFSCPDFPGEAADCTAP